MDPCPSRDGGSKAVANSPQRPYTGEDGQPGGWMHMRQRIAYLAAIAVAALWASGAYAERRVALVIGNGAYKNAPRLPNPINDAQDVSASLKRNGFDTIV